MSLIDIQKNYIDPRDVANSMNAINKGIVVVPTDTLYAFAVKLSNRSGIENLCYLIGKKPEKANLSILCSDLKNISDFTLQFPKTIYKILNKNLPGPFTFILNANNKVPKMFLNKRKTIGIRVPNHKFTLNLIEELGEPLVVASVHHPFEKEIILSNAEEIYKIYQNKIELMINDGELHSEGSAVIDCTQSEPSIIREAEIMPVF